MHKATIESQTDPSTCARGSKALHYKCTYFEMNTKGKEMKRDDKHEEIYAPLLDCLERLARTVAQDMALAGSSDGNEDVDLRSPSLRSREGEP